MNLPDYWTPPPLGPLIPVCGARLNLDGERYNCSLHLRHKGRTHFQHGICDYHPVFAWKNRDRKIIRMRKHKDCYWCCPPRWSLEP